MLPPKSISNGVFDRLKSFYNCVTFGRCNIFFNCYYSRHLSSHILSSHYYYSHIVHCLFGLPFISHAYSLSSRNYSLFSVWHALFSKSFQEFKILHNLKSNLAVGTSRAKCPYHDKTKWSLFYH